MVKYTIFSITHQDFDNIFIEYSKNYKKTIQYYKRLLNKNKGSTKMINFITDNNISVDTLEFNVITEMEFKSIVKVKKYTRIIIDTYDTKNNGLNSKLPYLTRTEIREKMIRCNCLQYDRPCNWCSFYFAKYVIDRGYFKKCITTNFFI